MRLYVKKREGWGQRTKKEREGRWERESRSSLHLLLSQHGWKNNGFEKTLEPKFQNQTENSQGRPGLDLPPALRHGPLTPSLESLQQELQEDLSGGPAPASEWSGGFIYLLDFGSFVCFHFNHRPLGEKKDPEHTDGCQRPRETGWVTCSK